jgi:FkbM family methyltransferase
MKIDRHLYHTFLSNLLNKNSITIDLGANKGKFSEYIATNYKSTVYSFEPVPRNFENIPNLPLIHKKKLCVMDYNGECEINASKKICPSIYKVRESANEDTLIVPCVTLKDFLKKNKIDKVNLLKVDIEGAEINLFNSLDKDILSNIDQITIEFHDFIGRDNIKKIIKKLSRDFYCVRFMLRNYGDILCIRKKIIPKSYYYYLKFCKRFLMAIERVFKRTFLKFK